MLASVLVFHWGGCAAAERPCRGLNPGLTKHQWQGLLADWPCFWLATPKFITFMFEWLVNMMA